jgi:EpsD family peptidyl-prolyl cis-trans isomerase
MGQRIVLAIVLAFVVSSCEKKPGGQTVAVVNNEEITAADLNAELNNATVPGAAEGDQSKLARSQALERLVDRRLLAQQAKSDGLDKSPEYLNQQRRLTEDLLINMLISRQSNTQQVPTADAIAQFEAARPGMFAKHEIWTLQQITYPLPKDPALTAKIAASKSLDEVAQVLGAAGVQFTRGTRQFDSALLNPQLYAQLSNLASGEPFIAPGPDKAIASVISARQPAPFTPDQARQLALSQMKRDQANQIVARRVKELKAKAKITYQPGFGPTKS